MKNTVVISIDRFKDLENKEEILNNEECFYYRNYSGLYLKTKDEAIRRMADDSHNLKSEIDLLREQIRNLENRTLIQRIFNFKQL